MLFSITFSITTTCGSIVFDAQLTDAMYNLHRNGIRFDPNNMQGSFTSGSGDLVRMETTTYDSNKFLLILFQKEI
jgi:hypothetical protein